MSVASKWYFEEENQALAVSLADQFKNQQINLAVPDFFYIEFANVCWKKVRRGSIKTVDALDTLDDLVKLALPTYSDGELFDVAIETAFRLGVSVYDALYISLAEIYVAPLVTADEALVSACKNRFDLILPLSEV